MNIHRIAIYLLLVMGMIGMQSCIKGIAKAKITEERGAIPPDFGKDESTLLCVLYGRKSLDKYLKKNFAEYYHGKYIFVERSELDKEIFSNVDLYRYVFGMSTHSSGSGSQNYITAQLSVTDRKENKVYNSPLTSSFFSKLMKAYLINLEKKRLKSQQQ